MSENINQIKKIFLENEKTLLINYVSDEVDGFYELLISKLSKKYNLEIINMNIFDKTENESDLFERNKIYIYFINNSKKFEEVANNKLQKIIFTDYKNFKKFKNNFNTVNGYDYPKDIRAFLNDYYKIDNEDLINFCIRQPYFTFSEATKFIVNSTGYTVDTSINDSSNFILDIRKDIFKIKKSPINVKKLYLLLKDEVKYKVLNFLTY